LEFDSPMLHYMGQSDDTKPTATRYATESSSILESGSIYRMLSKADSNVNGECLNYIVELVIKENRLTTFW
jgi:hypothetical protein